MKALLAAAGLPDGDIDSQFGHAYVVAVSDGEVVASAAIETYDGFGLLRSVVVAPSLRGFGVGDALTRERLAWARESGLHAVYLLTTTAADYFRRLGFTVVARTAVPAPVLRASEFVSVCPSSATVMCLDLGAAESRAAAVASDRIAAGPGAAPRPSMRESSCAESCEPKDRATPASQAVSDGALPVAIIGAGPIGLAAAIQLAAKGVTPLVFEAGETVGASVRQWGHVRLFSPWKYLVDPVAGAMLEATGWVMPDPEALPTGRDLLEQLLEPMAALPVLAPHIRLGHRVLAVTRAGYDKVRSTGRDTVPFELVVRGPAGAVSRVLARAVIDASGTWRTPNPLGAGGLEADGEASAQQNIVYGIPDVAGRDRGRYAGKRVLVVGSGHSAFNALLDLVRLTKEEAPVEIRWGVRRAAPGLMFGGGVKDALPARGALGARLQRLVERGVIHLETGVRVTRVTRMHDGLRVWTDTGRYLGPIDEIIVATGFRPDLSLTRELRLRLDASLEAPEQLAPLIDPNQHSCGTVYPHGAFELAHPEKGYYIVGMKSYGRAPTFLLLTGYEQVRSVACALVGDEAGARDVQLVLPETGVCQTDCIVDIEPGQATSCAADPATARCVGPDALLSPVAASCTAPDGHRTDDASALRTCTCDEARPAVLATHPACCT